MRDLLPLRIKCRGRESRTEVFSNPRLPDLPHCSYESGAVVPLSGSDQAEPPRQKPTGRVTLKGFPRNYHNDTSPRVSPPKKTPELYKSARPREIGKPRRLENPHKCEKCSTHFTNRGGRAWVTPSGSGEGLVEVDPS